MDIDWADRERLIQERGLEIDRPRDTDHPRNSGWSYPLDYGSIPRTVGGDNSEVDVFCRSADTGLTGAILVRHDGHEELKLL